MWKGPGRKKKYILVFNIVIIIIVIYSYFKFNIFNYDDLANTQEMINTLLSYSGIIAGFLFTGLSLILTLLDKKSIMRLYKFNYLDDLIVAAKIGLTTSSLSIGTCLFVLFLKNSLYNEHTIYFILFLLSLLSTFNFAYASYRVFKLFTELKE